MTAIKKFRRQLQVFFSTAMVTCLFTNAVFAGEQISVERSLNWSDELRIFSTLEQKAGESLQFDGAAFEFVDNIILPVYGEAFSITSTAIVNVSLQNEVYETVVGLNEKQLTGLRTKLGKTITINQSIGYAQKQAQLDISFVPLRLNSTTGQLEKLVRFTIVVNTSGNISYKLDGTDEFAEGSVLATGNWYKVAISKEGIFKIDRNWLNNNGLTGTISFNDFGVFGNGGGMLPESNAAFRYDDLQENAIYKFDANGNGFFEDGDYIYFYGQTQHRWFYNEALDKFTHANNIYSDKTYYFITPDQGTGKYIQDKASEATDNISTAAYDVMSFIDNDKINLANTGRKWFSEIIDIYNPDRAYNFNMPGLITSEPVLIRSNAAGASLSGSSVLTYKANGITLPTGIVFSELVPGFTETFAYDGNLETTFNATG